ncbi:MAG: AbrB/MazE/SpoVT family DNA-binding domain-containing protein, partial [Gammaproteobacteria bacterium]
MRTIQEGPLFIGPRFNGAWNAPYDCLTSVRMFLTVRNVLTNGMAMITSKLTSKAQTTIPQPVRAALRLKEGDELVYQIDEDRVILTKARH